MCREGLSALSGRERGSSVQNSSVAVLAVGFENAQVGPRGLMSVLRLLPRLTVRDPRVRTLVTAEV